MLACTLVENHSLRTVQEHSAFTPPLHRGGEDLALDVAALVDELLGREVMVHASDALLNDRAFIEVGGDEVGRGADDLDAALVRLVVGLGALERRQERVVDVDDLPGHGAA